MCYRCRCCGHFANECSKSNTDFPADSQCSNTNNKSKAGYEFGSQIKFNTNSKVTDREREPLINSKIYQINAQICPELSDDFDLILGRDFQFYSKLSYNPKGGYTFQDSPDINSFFGSNSWEYRELNHNQDSCLSAVEIYLKIKDLA